MLVSHVKEVVEVLEEAGTNEISMFRFGEQYLGLGRWAKQLELDILETQTDEVCPSVLTHLSQCMMIPFSDVTRR